MPTQIIGSIAINNLLPIAARGAGSVSWGPVAVPAGYSVIAVTFDLQQVASLTAIFSATFQLALDGVTFVDIGSGVGLDLSKSGFVLNAGVLTRPATDPLGPGPVRIFGRQVFLNGTDLTTRQLKGTLSSSEALTSGVTLTAF
jgi:hypothetical protein